MLCCTTSCYTKLNQYRGVLRFATVQEDEVQHSAVPRGDVRVLFQHPPNGVCHGYLIIVCQPADPWIHLPGGSLLCPRDGCGHGVAVCGWWSVACGLWSLVCGMWSVALWLVVCGWWSEVRRTFFVVSSLAEGQPTPVSKMRSDCF